MQSPSLPDGWMSPDLGHGVRTLMSARTAGDSLPPFDEANLGDHVGDAPGHVGSNRLRFEHLLGARPIWLHQVHGERVVHLSPRMRPQEPIEADGALATEPGVACVVMVADCLPILLAAPEGRGVAALHAGWRGLAGAGPGGQAMRGIVHQGVRALCEATATDPADLVAWLGPCIGPERFEVGADVLRGFGVDAARGCEHPRFRPIQAQAGAKWLADLAGLARDRLSGVGVNRIQGGTWCTVSEPLRFFSYRRDARTGRQAAAICLR